MGIPYSEWLDRAQRLPEGRSQRVSHLCGEGDVLTIEHNREGYRCWCFRCNDGGFKPHGRQALAAYINRWNEAAANYDQRTIALPRDLTISDMPWAAARWLGAANITSRLAEQYRIGYSAEMGRVYLPVYGHRGGKLRLLYYQARAVHEGQTPKYLNPKAYKPELWFNSSIYPGAPGGKVLREVGVVTEDILSAIRTGQVRRCSGLSLLGTSASTWHLAQLMRFKEIVIWLDPDAAGERGAKKLRDALSLAGISTSQLRTERDPKLYHHDELQEILECHLTSHASA